MKPQRFAFGVALLVAMRGCYQSTSVGSDHDASQAVVCAGTTCASGQICCYTTGQCVAPSSGACVLQSDASVSDAGGTPCASNADCAPTEFCGGLYCLGPGTCTPRMMTIGAGYFCGGPEPDVVAVDCEICGCDGVTYPSLQAFLAADVRATGGHVCGAPETYAAGPDAAVQTSHVWCGFDSQCPSGQVCCGLYGLCVDPSCTWCCQLPPAGTYRPCDSNVDCGSQWGGYCQGTGCGTPGGCVSPPAMSSCAGVVAEVCGCDGQTYTNECYARAALVRVAHTGACTTTCSSNADCQSGFCLGTGCGTPGGCVSPPATSSCAGVVAEVCGCDGQTYTNECYARAALVRVAHTGPCGDAG